MAVETFQNLLVLVVQLLFLAVTCTTSTDFKTVWASVYSWFPNVAVLHSKLVSLVFVWVKARRTKSVFACLVLLLGYNFFAETLNQFLCGTTIWVANACSIGSIIITEANVFFVLSNLCFALMAVVSTERLWLAQFVIVNSMTSQLSSTPIRSWCFLLLYLCILVWH